ncbi:hypothetical protein Ndes2526A_g00622 [Nannochloris sp. 'desiccata']
MAAPRQITFPPPSVIPSPPPPLVLPPPGTPPLATFDAPGLDFSLILPGFTTASFNTAQQEALCSAITTGWNASPRSVSCSIGSVSPFNGTNVLVSGYAFFTWNSAPTVTDLQVAAALRDARVVALTNDVSSVLGSVFPAAVPNCACDGTSVVTVPSTTAFSYNTNITGIPGPMQCGARLTYDNSNSALVNQVGVDDGSISLSSFGKYCSTPAVTGGVLGVPGSGTCRQYGVVASASGTTQATATATVMGGVVSTTTLAGGSGYSSAPTVAVSAPNPLPAQVAFTLNTGFQPTAGAVPVSASNGPYSAPPQVASLSTNCVDTSNTCTGAQVSYQISSGGGSTLYSGTSCRASDITPAQIDASGSVIASAGLAFPSPATTYCTSTPTITLSTNTLQIAVTAQITATISSGSVSALNVVSPGSGYRTAPTITISAPVTDSIGKLCSPAPITALPSSIAVSNPSTITTTGGCQPLGRDTYTNKVCSVPAAPGGMFSPINAYTCNVVSSFIAQPGSTVTNTCGVIAQSFVFIAFSTEKSQCSNTTVMLRTSNQSKGNRRSWRLNASATAGTIPAATGIAAIGRLNACRNTKFINLAAANSAPSPRLAGTSWKNRIIPVDVGRGCNTVWIQAAGNNPFAGRYLGYGSCSSQTAFKWEAASSSTAIQWRLRRV